jgi:hypothetical protein
LIGSPESILIHKSLTRFKPVARVIYTFTALEAASGRCFTLDERKAMLVELWNAGTFEAQLVDGIDGRKLLVTTFAQVIKRQPTLRWQLLRPEALTLAY